MGEYFFGVGIGKLTNAAFKKAEKIAKKHGASVHRPKMPGGPRYWFACPNQGHPFDGQRASAVMVEILAAKIAPWWKP